MTSLARKNTTMARPLKVLVPLIKEELAQGEAAGLEHYRRAGEMLLEAKEQIPYGNFGRWLATNFHLGKSTAYYYMDLAKKDEVVHRGGQAEPTSLRAALGRKPDTKWKPLQAAARNLDAELFATERQTEQEEIGLHRDLAAELVDIGYKALATRLHPDKGGSKDAMVRLKRVRDELMAVAKTRRFV